MRWLVIASDDKGQQADGRNVQQQPRGSEPHHGQVAHEDVADGPAAECSHHCEHQHAEQVDLPVPCGEHPGDRADGDAEVIELLRRRGTGRGGVTLDSETFQVAQIAALTAVDASPQSWAAVFDRRESEITFDTVLMTLVAAAPIVGTPRVISAAANIVGATNLADEFYDDIA